MSGDVRLIAEEHPLSAVEFRSVSGSLKLDGRWTQLRWPVRGTAQVTSDAGTFSLRGPLPYTYTIDGNFASPASVVAGFTAYGNGIIGGGLTPVAAETLARYGGLSLVGGYLAAMSLVSLVALMMMRPRTSM